MGYTYLYQIECFSPNHYYVGITTNPAKRFRQHRMRTGAQWTKLHGVKSAKVIGRFETRAAALEAENKRVLQLMRRGFTVSGGIYQQVKTPHLVKPPRRKRSTRAHRAASRTVDYFRSVYFPRSF